MMALHWAGMAKLVVVDTRVLWLRPIFFQTMKNSGNPLIIGGCIGANAVPFGVPCFKPKAEPLPALCSRYFRQKCDSVPSDSQLHVNLIVPGRKEGLHIAKCEF